MLDVYLMLRYTVLIVVLALIICHRK